MVGFAKEFLETHGFNSSLNITPDCINFLNYVFFNFTISTKELFFLFVQKFFLDSSINKGDLLNYDNCLMLINDYKIENYIIYPSYVISFVNDPINSRNYKNKSYFLKTNYIISLCLPFGFKNASQKENNIPMCSDEDYNNVVKFLFDIFDDMNNITIKSFTLHKNNIKASNMDKLYGIIGIIIWSLPLIIVIFLAISKKIIIIINNQKKKNLNNELIEEDDKKNIIVNKVNKKVKFPNWYIYLNEFFNILKNGKELFNFSLNNTNYNNVNLYKRFDWFFNYINYFWSNIYNFSKFTNERIWNLGLLFYYE